MQSVFFFFLFSIQQYWDNMKKVFLTLLYLWFRFTTDKTFKYLFYCLYFTVRITRWRQIQHHISYKWLGWMDGLDGPRRGWSMEHLVIDFQIWVANLFSFRSTCVGTYSLAVILCLWAKQFPNWLLPKPMLYFEEIYHTLEKDGDGRDESTRTWQYKLS